MISQNLESSTSFHEIFRVLLKLIHLLAQIFRPPALIHECGNKIYSNLFIRQKFPKKLILDEFQSIFYRFPALTTLMNQFCATALKNFDFRKIFRVLRILVLAREA